MADGSEDDFHRTVDVAGDLREQVLTDLSPGKPYTVAITTLAKTPSRENETSSHPVKNVSHTHHFPEKDALIPIEQTSCLGSMSFS